MSSVPIKDRRVAAVRIMAALCVVLALMWLLYLPVPVIGYLRGRRRMGVPE